MGFQLFKKKSTLPPPPPTPTKADPTHSAIPLSPTATSPTPSSASSTQLPYLSQPQLDHSRFRTTSFDAKTLGVASLTTSGSGSESRNSWDDVGVPLPPTQQNKVWMRNTGSSVSLPLTAMHQEKEREVVVLEKENHGRSTWLGIGGKKKKRSGSIASLSSITGGFGKIVGGGGKQEAQHRSSYRPDSGEHSEEIVSGRTRRGKGLGKENHGAEGEEGGGGFFVKSFRTVSRVHEDPISLGPYESLPSSNSSPPLPALPSATPSPPRAIFMAELDAAPARSSSPYAAPEPQRPAFPHSRSSSLSSPYAASPSSYNPKPPFIPQASFERSASPTISAGAFRGRNRSTGSLVSLNQYPEVEVTRPKFEPKRRGSMASELDFSVPKPIFNEMETITKSNSGVSLSSFNTANESPRKSATPSPTPISTPIPTKPPGPERSHSLAASDASSFDDTVLRFMEAYEERSPSPTSPVVSPSPSLTSVPNTMHQSTPSLSLQPASPVPSASTQSTPRGKAVGGAAGLSPSTARRVVTPSKLPAGWDSSDSEEEDEDEKPLAKKSVSNMSLNSAFVMGGTNMGRMKSNELEVLADEERKRMSEQVVINRRNSQRRSLSTFALASTPLVDLDNFTPPSLGQRTVSSPVAQPLNGSPSSSSGSDSVPTTPKDHSPNPSISSNVNTKRNSQAPSIRFEPHTELRSSSRQSLGAGRGHFSRPSLPFAGPPRSAPAIGFTTPRTFAPTQLPSPSKTTHGILKNSPSGEKDLFSSMKARHKAEARQADAIGRDLNGPSGMIKDDSDDEDDEVPLASLPAKHSSRAGSTIGPPLSSYGAFPPSAGGFSQLQFAPPGIDPALYAYLPPGQKMGLHMRSQQMMQDQFRARSQAGWETGSNASSATGFGGGDGGRIPQSMSMGNLSYMGGQSTGLGFMPPPMGMGMGLPMGMGYGTMPMPNTRLPPFAPSFASSQPFFQQPVYASSPIGGRESTIGLGRPGHRSSASTIGFSR